MKDELNQERARQQVFLAFFLYFILHPFSFILSSPTTTTAPADPAAATPKQALRSLNLALRDGDAAAIRSLFLTQNEDEARLIGAMADYSAALVALHHAAEKSYGHDGANMVTGDISAQSADGLAAIEKAEITSDGEHALIRFPRATDPPVKLTQIDGRWKLPLGQLLDGADRTAQQHRFAELTLQTRLARETAIEINAGKYKEGPSRAAAVWRSRLLASTSEHPTTRPTK